MAFLYGTASAAACKRSMAERSPENFIWVGDLLRKKIMPFFMERLVLRLAHDPWQTHRLRIYFVEDLLRK